MSAFGSVRVNIVEMAEIGRIFEVAMHGNAVLAVRGRMQRKAEKQKRENGRKIKGILNAAVQALFSPWKYCFCANLTRAVVL